MTTGAVPTLGGVAPQPRAPYPPDPASWRWDVGFVVACIVSFVGLLMLDERTPTSPAGTMASVGDVWMPGPGMALRSMWDSLAEDASTPYLAALLLLHVATAAALYVYARPRTGRMIAFAVGLVFLSLVTSDDSPLAGCAICWSGAAATGAWALVILLGPAPIRLAWLAGALLLVGAAMSFVAVPFLVAAAVVLLPASRRRYLWLLVPAAVTIAAWIIVDGADALAAFPSFNVALGFARESIADAIGHASGMGADVGLVLAVLFGLATLGTLVSSDSIRLGLVAGFVGLVTLFAVVAMVRTDLLVDATVTSSSLYPATVFSLIGLSSWLGHRPLDVPGQRLRLLAVVAILTTVAVSRGVGW